MKVIIAGSRDNIEYQDVLSAMGECPWSSEITEVVSGKARGVDTLGEQWAIENNISIKEFPADWKKFGRSAGIKRNEQMGDYADALVAVWDGESKGTKHMIDYSKNKGLKVFVYNLKDKKSLLSQIFG
jgi:hypothetical protein